MSVSVNIDFVSDVSCPWCVIGLRALEAAIARLGDEVETEIHFQPFELNPRMPPEGQDIGEHLAEKYGATPAQSERTRAMIRERGAEVGFAFALDQRSRIYNTFDAHRLLHWAQQEGRQLALKRALFKAYFSDGENPGAHEVLIRLADEVGLDGARARQILASDAYAEAVRARQRYYLEQGISAVPAVIVNRRHLIQGGHPAAVFEQALRQIVAESQ